MAKIEKCFTLIPISEAKEKDVSLNLEVFSTNTPVASTINLKNGYVKYTPTFPAMICLLCIYL